MEDEASAAGASDRRSRSGLVLVVVCWGVGIGAAAGAVAGTALAPLVGTLFGLVIGVAVALAPTCLGAVALWLAARPGTPHAVFRRRTQLILMAVAVGVGVAWLVASSNWLEEEFVGPTLLGVLLSCGLLWRAERSIGSFRPDPTERSGRPEVAVAAVLVSVLLVGIAAVLWSQLLSPDARGRRAIAGELDRVAEAVRTPLADRHGDDRPTVRCRSGAAADATQIGFLARGEGRSSFGPAEDLLAGAQRHLDGAGYTVVQQLEPARGRGWVYGWTEERTVVVRAWTPDDLVDEQVEVSVMVSGGCPQLQPTFEADLDAPGDVAPALTSATVAAISQRSASVCGGDGPTTSILVGFSGAPDVRDDDLSAWQLVGADGRPATPCAVTVDRSASLVELLAPADTTPPIAVRLVRPADPDLGSEAIDLAVDVTPSGSDARPLAARAVVLDIDQPLRTVPGCPTDTVQAVALVWDREMPVDEHRPGLRVELETEGDRRRRVPTAVVATDGEGSRSTAAAQQVLCLDRPGTPIRVQGTGIDVPVG